MNSSFRCQVCFSIVNDSDAFCSHCGGKFSDIQDEAKVAKLGVGSVIMNNLACQKRLKSLLKKLRSVKIEGEDILYQVAVIGSRTFTLIAEGTKKELSIDRPQSFQVNEPRGYVILSL